MSRTGIADAELARRMEISRLTVIRWKEGVTARPRHREDVVRCAEVLRLTPDELDEFLLSAGFSPENSLPPGTDASPRSDEAEPAGPPEAAPVQIKKPRRRYALIAGPIAVLVIAAVFAGLAAAGAFSTGPDPLPVPPPTPRNSSIVIAPFVNYASGQQGFNVRGRIRSEIEREILAAGVSEVKIVEWPEAITNETAAAEAALTSGATILIWGEYDTGRAVAILTISRSPDTLHHQRVVDTPSSPGGLPSSINTGLPDEVRSIALLTLGQLYLEREEFDLAKTVLNQALLHPPTDPTSLAALRYRLGRAYMGGELADLDEAIELFTQVLEVKPRSVDGYNSRALAYLERGRSGDLELAINDFSRAVSIAPGSPAAYVNRAAALLDRGNSQDLGQVFSDLRQAIAIDPGAPAPYINRAGAYALRDQDGDRDLALEDFQRAIDLEPTSPWGYFNRGLFYSGVQDWKKSNADFRQAHELIPEAQLFNNVLCLQLAVQRKGEEALPYCQAALAAEPAGPALDSRGLAYGATGSVGSSVADFTEFLDWLSTSAREECASRYRPSRENWIAELEAGRDPFDKSTLEAQRARLVPRWNKPC